MVRDREVIGRGRTAEILVWDDRRVMKLYLAGSSRDYVRREAEVSRLAHRAGLPAPAVYDTDAPDGVHEVDGRLGILFERIDGPTMMRDLGTRPWMLIAYSRQLASLHARIHAAPGEGLPPLRKRIEWSIERASESITERARAEAGERLDALPDVRQVCHGDFHPDNVILRTGSPMVIDWGPASAGHPAADVAWTYLLYRFAGTPPGTPTALRLLLAVVRRWSLCIYLRTYSRLTGRSWAEVRAWVGLIAILRLADNIPEERTRLIRLIERELGQAPSL
ncbi:MAG: aminoglycoside phosphotransferase family protein [Candidatus Bipolaricaulis sp.]|nr:aminoglycoside phosphotransferase family protein [Candidatus Bipolaricaulis sp.]